MAADAFSRWIDHILGAGPLRVLFQNPKRILHKYVKPGMIVLDIGCGEGFFSLEMGRMVGPDGNVVCVDIRPDAIKSLKEQATKAGLSERIETRVCSDDSLKLDDMTGRIHFALAFYVLHHAADARKLMTQIHEALEHGGRLMVVEPGHHASVSQCETIEAWARQTGFSIVDYPRLIRQWAVLFVKN
jgi:ubiquinone/menaquinone biosynthesis C-methylase UbiE